MIFTLKIASEKHRHNKRKSVKRKKEQEERDMLDTLSNKKLRYEDGTLYTSFQEYVDRMIEDGFDSIGN